MKLHFVKYRLFYLIFSLGGILAGFAFTYGHFGGFARSISFNGGIRLTVVLSPSFDRAMVESAIKEAGFEHPIVRQADVKENKYDIEFGPDVRDVYQAKVDQINAEGRKQFEEERKHIQLTEGQKRPVYAEKTVAGEIEDILLPHLKISSDDVISREVISASYGSDLFRTSFMATIYALFLITLYVSFRFELSFALGATLALVHDIFFTLAYIGVMQIEPSVPVVAAMLTLVGYSINDTIIVFDRIRATMSDRSELVSSDLIDKAITGTLSRTLITSVLTLLSLVAILVSGAESLMDFASVLVFGIMIGTYSSICVASPIMHIYEQIRLKRITG